MKKYLLGAAAILTIAMPVTAQAETNGYLGATWGSVDVESPIGDADDDVIGIDGAVAFGGNGGLGFELDASYASFDEADSNNASVAGHVFGRNASHLFGAFASYTDADDTTFWSAGIEAEKYLSNWTLAGSLGLGKLEEDVLDTETDLWGVNGEARYFVNDNLRLEAGLGWSYLNVDAAPGDVDDDAISYNLGAEWQFSGAPISLLAGWSQTESDESEIENSALTVGARWNFGGGTLKDRDRTGASLAGLSRVGALFGL
jgi:hypothetical protein